MLERGALGRERPPSAEAAGVEGRSTGTGADNTPERRSPEDDPQPLALGPGGGLGCLSSL